MKYYRTRQEAGYTRKGRTRTYIRKARVRPYRDKAGLGHTWTSTYKLADLGKRQD